MAAYFKNVQGYKLQNRQVCSACTSSHVTQFLWKLVKDLGHTST